MVQCTFVSLKFWFSSYEGVTSNTDAAQLAETFAEAKCATKVHWSFFNIYYYLVPFCLVLAIMFPCLWMDWSHLFEQVVGVPVTLNGDLKNQFVETTVGFDTICKVGAAELTSLYLDSNACFVVKCFMVLHFFYRLYITYYVFCIVVFTFEVSYCLTLTWYYTVSVTVAVYCHI